MNSDLNLFKYYNMDKKNLIQIVKNKYNLQDCVSYKADAYHLSDGGSAQILQGYVVDDYFIDAKTLQVFNKSYFNMINNVEDNENI